MLQFILVTVICWLISVFGWSQIIGSIQNIKVKQSLWFTLILWIVILTLVAYFAISKFDGLWPTIIGYGIALILTLRSGKIQ